MSAHVVVGFILDFTTKDNFYIIGIFSVLDKPAEVEKNKK